MKKCDYWEKVKKLISVPSLLEPRKMTIGKWIDFASQITGEKTWLTRWHSGAQDRLNQRSQVSTIYWKQIAGISVRPRTRCFEFTIPEHSLLAQRTLRTNQEKLSSHSSRDIYKIVDAIWEVNAIPGKMLSCDVVSLSSNIYLWKKWRILSRKRMIPYKNTEMELQKT